MTGKFYGLGVGPGDPELITLKTYKILEKVDVLCYPISNADGKSLAMQVVSRLITKKYKCLELSFPMTTEVAKLEESWAEAGEKIAREMLTGHQVAFITIGDPMLYSTYGYILRYLSVNYPEFKTETVPGVMSLSAAASALGLPLVESYESLAILPAAYGLESLRDVIEQFDTVILLKVSKKITELIKILESLEMKEKAAFISRCGYPDQFITYNLDILKQQEPDYMSLIIIKKKGFENFNPEGNR